MSKTHNKRRNLLMPLFVRCQKRGGMQFRIAALCLCGILALRALLVGRAGNTNNVVQEGPELMALEVLVDVNDPFDCKTITANQKHPVSVFIPKTPRLVQGFPATPLISTGFMKETPSADAIVFTARSSKLPNGPILSTGSNMLFNTGEKKEEEEYRLLWLRASLNYTSIHDEEGVESDVCVTIVSQSKQNSVSSGEEVFCTHEHYYGGDDASVGPIVFDFSPGGFPLRDGSKLIIASVSKIFNPEAFSPLDDVSVRARDAPETSVVIPGLGEVKTSLDLLALNFEALIVPSDSQIVNAHVGLRSVRSPLRDRSIFALPNSEILPLTEFQNTKTEPVQIRSLGIFRSMLNHYVAGDTMIRILVDGKEVHQICLAPHRPNESSAPFSEIAPLDITLSPNSIIRVEHSLVEHMPGQGSYTPAPYDLAVYILYEHPDFSSDALVPINDDPLGFGQLDLNGDGHFDFVDYDAYGTIWADLTLPDGSHDTQHTLFLSLITNKGRFNKPTTEWKWTRNPQSNLMEASVTDPSNNLCFHLRSRTVDSLVFEYCDESAVPFMTLMGSDDRAGNFCIGDFDGDGHLDRVRLEASYLNDDFSLFFAKGDGSKYKFEKFVATVKGSCWHENPRMACTYKPSARRHVMGYSSKCDGFRHVDLSSLTL